MCFNRFDVTIDDGGLQWRQEFLVVFFLILSVMSASNASVYIGALRQ